MGLRIFRLESALQLAWHFRTLYNFCWPIQFWDEKETPSQRLGVTEKQFSIEDIVYFK